MKYRAQCAAILLSLASIAIGRAEPLEPRVVHVIDGDTSAATLSGSWDFDAPETGERARCKAERTLGARASFRLRQIVAGGAIDLQMIACSCRPGTEGTPRCNYGRSCGALSVGIVRCTNAALG